MEQQIEFYRRMFTIRTVEETLLELFAQGKLRGTVHTCIGQEADAVGVLSALKTGDIVFSNHRCHGHYLALFDDVYGLVAEIMGRQSGICGGRGGSQHLQRDNFYTNGIQGGIVPEAVGMAWAEKLKGSNSLAVVFLGDGTLGQGVVYESMNLASLWQVPILFVIENNGYAQSTPSSAQIAGQIRSRPEAFAITTTELTSTDVQEIYARADAIIQSVRREVRPACLIINTYRLAPHSKGDDYRDPEEIEHYRGNDPLLISRRRLVEQRQVAAERLDELQSQCRHRVRQAVKQADSDPPGRIIWDTTTDRQYAKPIKTNGNIHNVYENSWQGQT